jgi:hypothetical protein
MKKLMKGLQLDQLQIVRSEENGAIRNLLNVSAFFYIRPSLHDHHMALKGFSCAEEMDELIVEGGIQLFTRRITIYLLRRCHNGETDKLRDLSRLRTPCVF